MSVESLIEWTDATWNPLLGCDKCSAGCALCYAIRTAWRLRHNPNPTIAAAYEGLVEKRSDGSLNWTGKINLLPERLREPMTWRKPRRIFVNSQSDLFHESVAFEFVDQVFGVMALCRQHTFQVLTKRPERMREYLAGANVRRDISQAALKHRIYMDSATNIETSPYVWPLRNVWLGTSVEDQRAANERIPPLLATPAAVRFLSCEPLLGRVSLCDIPGPIGNDPLDALGHSDPDFSLHVKPEQHGGIQWVIAGGESGLKNRPGQRRPAPMHPDWVRDLRDQCQAACVPFFFKQWGNWMPHPHPPQRGVNTGMGIALLPDGKWGCQGDWWDGTAQAMDCVGKGAAGRLLDGREWNEMPDDRTRIQRKIAGWSRRLAAMPALERAAVIAALGVAAGGKSS